MTLFHGLGPFAASGIASGDFDFITSASGTAVSSISVDNCFSASYSTYLVLRNVSGSSASLPLNVRLRVSATDASGANYRNQFVQASSTTVNGQRFSGRTAWDAPLGRTETGAEGFARFWISNPFEAVRTTGWADYGFAHTGNIGMVSYVYEHDLTTSYTGLTVLPSSGTITGTIFVLGVKS